MAAELPVEFRCRNHPTVEAGLQRCSRCLDPFCASCIVDVAGSASCVACKDEVVRALKSGEDVAVESASPWDRLFAFWIDMAAMGFLAQAVLYVAGKSGTVTLTWQDGAKGQWSADAVAAVALFALYEAVTAVAGRRTLGKWMFDVKIASPGGRNVRAASAIVRALLRPVILLSGVFFPLKLEGTAAGVTISAVPMLLDAAPMFFGKRRTLRDLIAGTAVVKVPKA